MAIETIKESVDYTRGFADGLALVLTDTYGQVKLPAQQKLWERLTGKMWQLGDRPDWHTVE